MRINLYGTRKCDECGGTGLRPGIGNLKLVCNNCQKGRVPIETLKEWIEFRLIHPYYTFKASIKYWWFK